jgi:dTDP-4-amino-4,6-dideoxy-D-galactose acyltransferase
MMIRALDWDTDFFGFPVGTLDLNSQTLDEEKLREEARCFRLVYVTSTKSQHSVLLSCGDTKCVFGKSPRKHETEPAVVGIPEEKTAEAVRIGLQSGLYSRFALDPKFESNTFEKLYKKWVERSVKNEIAYAALTILSSGDPTSIITLSESGNQESSIGLFAVDSKYRGQGIGNKLLKSAEALSFHRGDTQLTVATQGKNEVACSVYEKFGFQRISETYIYNYWNEAFTV